MKKITLYGGFHNVNDVDVEVTESQYEDIREGLSPLTDILTDSQIKRLDKHFCGVSDCKCGGVARAKVKIFS